MNTVIALLYDFDKTLGTRDMQEFEFIPSLGVSPIDFWMGANTLAEEEGMDGVLAYMYYMLRAAKANNAPIRREALVKQGKSVEYFEGVRGWFERINAFGASLGLTVEHYVLSSGLKEIIEGTDIAKYFKGIFASEFLYDKNGEAVWAKMAVNYTNKTQYVYRVNKGVLDISNDRDLNSSQPEHGRRVKFSNMIYLGDGLTDVPCMKLVRSSGGTSIALYSDGKINMVEDMLLHERVDFAYAADYTEGSPLDGIIHKLLRKLAADNALGSEREAQRKKLGECDG